MSGATRWTKFPTAVSTPSVATPAIWAPSIRRNLASNYGNADYDARHNITGSYVFTIPYKGGPHVLTDGWEVAGTVFHNTGFPFSVADSGTSGAFPGSNFAGVYSGRPTPVTKVYPTSAQELGKAGWNRRSLLHLAHD